MRDISILIPTKNRIIALAATLTSLLGQTNTNFSIIISDQSNIYTIEEFPTIKTIKRIFQEKGVPIHIFKHLPEKGMAEQRNFLLEKSSTSYSLFLDDDIILDSFAVDILLKTIKQYTCGFVGMAVQGLSFLTDVRLHQQKIEFWKSKIKPEKIIPSSRLWKRYLLHNAANLYHIQKRLRITPQNPKVYKVAWVGGCILYDTEKLHDVGGFSFWKDLPAPHAGEDVLAQLKVMEKYGGCGIIPTGAYHQELPTTISDRRVNAVEVVLNLKKKKASS